MGKGLAPEKLQHKMRRRLTENLASVKEKMTLRLRGLETSPGSSPRLSESPKQQFSPRQMLTLSGSPSSPRQRGSLSGLFSLKSDQSRLSRSQSVGLVERSSSAPAERSSSAPAAPDAASSDGVPAPRGSHANFGSAEPLVAPAPPPRAVSLLSPRLRRNTTDVSQPFNVTHTAGGLEKIQTIRSKARHGASQAELEELQRQLKGQDEWNPNL